MKLVVLLIAVLVAYVASDDVDSSASEVGETRQLLYYIQSTASPRRQTVRPQTLRPRLRQRRRGLFGGFDILTLIVLFSLFSNTQATPTPTTVTTADQFADWQDFLSCKYFVSNDIKTWDNARADCKGRGDGADLVSTGFSKVQGERDLLIAALGLTSKSYWIGATAEGVQNAGDPVTNDAWVGTGRPSDEPIPNLGTKDTVGGEKERICGRFLAGSSPETVHFEECDDRQFIYVCEYCNTD